MAGLFKKYKNFIAYLFFGGISGLINTAVYWACAEILLWQTIQSTAAAWLTAVIFIFFTNKILVFESGTWDKKTLKHEICSFFLCRAGTGILDILIMYIGTDKILLNGVIVKIISNIIVVLLNLAASKFVIFAKR